MASTRPARQAKMKAVDYAVLSSGQQIPDYSSSDGSSSDEPWGRVPTKSASQARRTAKTRTPYARRPTLQTTSFTCYVCSKRAASSSLFQCARCHRWYHERCAKQAPSMASTLVLVTTLCHECQAHDARGPKKMPSRMKPHVGSIQDVVRLLKRSKRILVIAGAGVSVSCGIPDFRSSDGIYAMVQQMDLSLPEPECVFHIDYFRDDPTPFFQVVRSVFTSSPRPSLTHRFMKCLERKQKLLRVYTQNIDGLEEAAGVTKCVCCHGSFTWSSCVRCKKKVATEQVLDVIRAGVIPVCTDQECRGILKPDITFFGELLETRVSEMITSDRHKVDLLLVIGTSLKVAPVAEIPGFLPDHVPQIVINRTPLKKKRLSKDSIVSDFDYTFLGNCDEIVAYLARQCGWQLDEENTGDLGSLEIAEHLETNTVCFGTCRWAPKDLRVSDDESSDSIDQVGHTCDGCSRAINQSDTRFSCKDCFDFDLCSQCIKSKSKSHYRGLHSWERSGG